MHVGAGRQLSNLSGVDYRSQSQLATGLVTALISIELLTRCFVDWASTNKYETTNRIAVKVATKPAVASSEPSSICRLQILAPTVRRKRSSKPGKSGNLFLGEGNIG